MIGGYKVTVKGTVNYNPVTGWQISTSSIDYEEDNSILSTLWYLPWDTKNIHVQGTLWDAYTYESETWLDSVLLLGGSQPYTLEFRHVKPGHYEGDLTVFEVELNKWGQPFFDWTVGELNRWERCSTTFEVDVEGE